LEECVARAPAKVILFGEHWVVHGGRALAAAVSLSVKVRCRRRTGGGVVVHSPRLGYSEDIARGCSSACSLAAVYRFLSQRVGSVAADCVIESDVPPGAGLGSSAAVSVAFAAAYACLAAGSMPARELVNAAAFEGEKIVHGNPSGVDNTVSTYGGFLVYRRGEGFRRLRASFGGDLRLVIVDTRVARSTKRAVETFTESLRSLGGLGGELVALNDRLVGEAVKAVLQGDAARLGALMYLSHGLLKAMGVSHERLDAIVEEARRLGAYGAKLSGAGMGGVAIVAAPAAEAGRIVEELRGKGLQPYLVRLGVEGVAVEL
jgi:mevalonate kinase